MLDCPPGRKNTRAPAVQPPGATPARAGLIHTLQLSGGLLARECSFTLSLEPHILLVGAGRFERPTPCAQGIGTGAVSTFQAIGLEELMEIIYSRSNAM